MAVHGAAMTNMIFMPFGGFVVEIGPREYANFCYHNLAEACALKYHNSMAKGDKNSVTVADVGDVANIIRGIANEMEGQMREEVERGVGRGASV